LPFPWNNPATRSNPPRSHRAKLLILDSNISYAISSYWKAMVGRFRLPTALDLQL